jgi:hypothetical protein
MIVFYFITRISPFTILVNIELIVNFIFNPLVALWVINYLALNLNSFFFSYEKSLKFQIAAYHSGP